MEDNTTFNGESAGVIPVVEARDEKGRFVPGISGNPAGRTKRKSFAEYFDEDEIEILISRIKQEIKGEPKGDIVKMVVEQIFGKPKQPLTGGDEDDYPIRLETSDSSKEKVKEALREIINENR